MYVKLQLFVAALSLWNECVLGLEVIGFFLCCWLLLIQCPGALICWGFPKQCARKAALCCVVLCGYSSLGCCCVVKLFLLSCPIQAVKFFQKGVFCGFEWDWMLSNVWETQWADRKTVQLTSGVCENLKEPKAPKFCIWLWTVAFEPKLSLQC